MNKLPLLEALGRWHGAQLRSDSGRGSADTSSGSSDIDSFGHIWIGAPAGTRQKGVPHPSLALVHLESAVRGGNSDDSILVSKPEGDHATSASQHGRLDQAGASMISRATRSPERKAPPCQDVRLRAMARLHDGLGGTYRKLPPRSSCSF